MTVGRGPLDDIVVNVGSGAAGVNVAVGAYTDGGAADTGARGAIVVGA
jgi:hypothetical protein